MPRHVSRLDGTDPRLGAWLDRTKPLNRLEPEFRLGGHRPRWMRPWEQIWPRGARRSPPRRGYSAAAVWMNGSYSFWWELGGTLLRHTRWSGLVCEGPACQFSASTACSARSGAGRAGA